jgi:hypothetical protein
MKVHKATAAGGAAGFGAVLILALVLGVLFWRSFLPNYVHFSNDGPLGQQNNAASALPAGFLGAWYDNNDIGAPGGAWAVAISALFRWAVGPVGYAKFLVPFALFILGLGAWSFFRQLKLSPLAAGLGALAAALNSTFFSNACWGVAPQEIAIGMDYFALALVVSLTAETPLLVRLARLGLAGLCVGMNVMEAADIGVIFSLFVAAFVVVCALNQEKGAIPARLGQGVWQVAVVAIFAGFIACQTIVSLVGITGVGGASQNTLGKEDQWNWATEWSLPKTETLGLLVPGLFGYKMDTPANMAPEFARFYAGGNYWGGMGRDPLLDPYFAAGRTGTPVATQWRQTSGTNYCGILVVLMALWAALQALRKENSVFSETQRRYIWFWSVAAVLCVLFAWGRFSFFYVLLYKLPFISKIFSVIRNPTKFLIVFSWCIVVLFAYGIDGFSRRYLPAVEKPKPSPLASSLSPLSALPKEEEKSWWAKAGNFDRQWTAGCGIAVVLSLLGWLIFSGERKDFRHYLATVGFPSDPDSDLAGTIALFSIHQAGWFVLLIVVAAGLTILVISGKMAGRTKLTGLLLGLFLFLDMGRADLPYITHWNYIQKYDIDTKNAGQSTSPILNLLKDKYYEHRVAMLPFGSPAEEGPDLFSQLYTIEWVQHQFPYYNIQTLDLFQRPRVSDDIAAYEGAIYFHGTRDGLPMLIRQWELTNTRYLLGEADFLDALDSLDPLHRFRIVERFTIGPKEGVTNPTKLEEIAALPDPNGRYALFEFSGALPRAKLYSTWQVNTNDDSTLKTLASPYFDPARVVLISTPETGLALTATNENKGTVEFASYKPTRIVLSTRTPAPAVLLYNSKYDPDWKVTVDGRPEPVLRCNYIMRGVYVSPGSHTVELTYSLPKKPLYITLAAYGSGILLGAFLLVSGITSHKKRP